MRVAVATVIGQIYAKRYGAPSGNNRTRSAPLLYNIGGSFSLTRDLEVYGSYYRGLEEAGVAPSSAANRNEILSAITVRQAEVGLRWTPARDFTLFFSGFDSRKPYAGVDATDNVFRFIGEVQHRGAEFSLAGRPLDRLRVVAGGVLLDPVLRRDEANAHGIRPVAVPRVRAILNADLAIPGVRGSSADAGVLHVGARAARSSQSSDGTQLKVRSVTSLNAGLRLVFALGKNDAVIRAQILNITNAFVWDVNASETLAFNEPRRGRVQLTVRL